MTSRRSKTSSEKPTRSKRPVDALKRLQQIANNNANPQTKDSVEAITSSASILRMRLNELTARVRATADESKVQPVDVIRFICKELNVPLEVIA